MHFEGNLEEVKCRIYEKRNAEETLKNSADCSTKRYKIIITQNRLFFLRYRAVRDMFYNISEVTVKNRTEVVKSVNFDIQVMAELIQQRTADAIAGIQIILRDSALLHCFPEFVVTYHL